MGYELVKNDLFFVHAEISFYEVNKDKFLKEVKDRHHNGSGKEKAAKYYKDNQNILKERAGNHYRNVSKEEKKVKRARGPGRYQNIKEYFLV